MGIIDGMLMEFSHETANTRKMLEIAPEKDFGWAPHPKSMTLGKLASHIAEIPGWTGVTLNMDVFEMDPATYKPVEFKTTKELVAGFDTKVAEAVEVLKGAKEDQLFKTWTMKVGGKAVFSMPKIAVLRAFIFSHSIHHRGQLSVYLRMRNVALPKVYGPTADDPSM